MSSNDLRMSYSLFVQATYFETNHAHDSWSNKCLQTMIPRRRRAHICSLDAVWSLGGGWFLGLQSAQGLPHLAVLVFPVAMFQRVPVELFRL